MKLFSVITQKAGGTFAIGSENCLFTKKAIITLTGKDGVGASHPDFGRKFLGIFS